MASNTNSTNASATGRTSSEPSGAAAEPEPEPPATTYHVRDYQNPDAGAADRPLTKAAKGKDKTKTKGKKGATTGPTQITHVSFAGRPPAARAAAVASRARVARFASAATAAWHAGLWRFQWRRWHSRPQQ